MGSPRGNGQNGGHFYSNITQPVKLDFNFIVDSTNGNGLGIRSLKSNGYVQNVFMNTSAPLSGSGNPNPAAGYALIKFQSNYKYYLGGFSGSVAPLSGSSVTSTTAGLVYVIVSLGTTTAAQWLAAGVPAGVVPAVGVAFVAIATGAIGGTGAVQVPGASSFDKVEAIGNTSLSMNAAVSTNSGMQLIVRFLDYAGALVAPSNGTTIGMSAYFDISSVTIDGL